MEKGFDINKIKVKTANEPSIEKKLTGEVITSLDPNSGVEPNAELEGKEFLQFPDGTIQMVSGNSHKKGGVKMHIPDGTKIISDKLKLNKDQVSKIKDEFDLKLSTKDTYATAMKKFDKHSGISKLNDEQEDLFKELKRQQQKDVDSDTSLINNEYLSKKINDIEKSKESKNGERNTFFDTVFDMQEESKSSGKAKKVKEDENFKYGGVSKKNFEALCEKHGISKKDAEELLKGNIPTYDKGGKKGDLPKYVKGGKYKTKEQVLEAYKNKEITEKEANAALQSLSEEYRISTGKDILEGREGIAELVHQSANEGAYGNVNKDNIDEVMMSLYRNFPDIVSAEDVFNVKYEDGKLTYNTDLDFSEKLEQVENLQSRVKARTTETVDVILNNKDKFSEEQVKLAEDFKNKEIFTDDGDTVKGIDRMLGNFTSTRYNLGLNIVTPEEKDVLEDRGIFTVKDLDKALQEDPDLLGETSKGKLEDLKSMMTDNSDFTLDTYTPFEPLEAVETKDKPDGKIVNDIEYKRDIPRLNFRGYPDQTPLPPSPMDAHMLAEARLGRIDPIRIGIEDKIQASNDRMKFTSDMVSNLPPEQQASILANAQANEAKALNDSIIKTNMVNAQNMASAELFNIGQSDREQLMTNQNKLSFEERQLRAKANTEEEFRNYFKELNRQSAEQYRWAQSQALLEQMTPEVSMADDFNIRVTPDGKIINDTSGLNSVGVRTN